MRHNSLEELSPRPRQAVLLMNDKEGRSCTSEDAATLASYAGMVPHTIEHTEFVQKLVS
jgi:hypothetical protein